MCEQVEQGILSYVQLLGESSDGKEKINKMEYLNNGNRRIEKVVRAPGIGVVKKNN